MPEYRRIYQKGGIYFFTLVTYQRQPIFLPRISREFLTQSIRKVQKYHPFDNIAYCYLPDHLHFIWQLPDSDSDYSTRIGLLKRDFSIKLHDTHSPMIERSASRIKRRESSIWQRRFWEHLIRDEEDLYRHIDYIHTNPVKHGLVKCPVDWESSSFSDFVQAGFYDTEWGESYEVDKSLDFGE